MASKEEKLPDEKIKADIDTIKTGAYPEEDDAKIGETRGQLFVRIPKRVRDRMKLTQGQKLHFKVWTEKDTTRWEVSVIDGQS